MGWVVRPVMARLVDGAGPAPDDGPAFRARYHPEPSLESQDSLDLFPRSVRILEGVRR